MSLNRADSSSSRPRRIKYRQQYTLQAKSALNRRGWLTLALGADNSNFELGLLGCNLSGDFFGLDLSLISALRCTRTAVCGYNWRCTAKQLNRLRFSAEFTPEDPEQPGKFLSTQAWQVRLFVLNKMVSKSFVESNHHWPNSANRFGWLAMVYRGQVDVLEADPARRH